MKVIDMRIIMTSMVILLIIAINIQNPQEEAQEHSQRITAIEEKEVPNIDPRPEIEEVMQEEPEFEQITVIATAYVSNCQGCTGITKGGTDVRNTIYHDSGYRIIATDPDIIPLGSIVEINGQKFIADDIGGAIKGYRIDILMESESEALEFGVREVEVTILKKGE